MPQPEPEHPSEQITQRLRQTTPKETVERLTDGMVWLGDLSGWEVSGSVAGAGQVALHHRCGWAITLKSDGICADFSVYLASIVEAAIKERANHRCAGHSR